MSSLLIISIHALRVEGDTHPADIVVQKVISIHALRVEGDFRFSLPVYLNHRFLSTPSGWRATNFVDLRRFLADISIHALRVEGDVLQAMADQGLSISIHALRVEGDDGDGFPD